MGTRILNQLQTQKKALSNEMNVYLKLHFLVLARFFCLRIPAYPAMNCDAVLAGES